MKWHPAIRDWTGTLEIRRPARRRLAQQGDSPTCAREMSLPESSYSMCIANTAEQRRQVAALVAKAYGRRGYDTAFLADETPAQDNLLTLMFNIDDKLAGTYTIRLETPEGIMADDSGFGDELAPMRKEGRSLVELCRFAVDPALPPGVAHQLVALQLDVLLMFSKTMGAMPTTFVIEVNPHHVRIWRGLGWKRVAGERWCDRVGAASVLLWINSEDFVAYCGGRTENEPRSSTWKQYAANLLPQDDSQAMLSMLRHSVTQQHFVI